MQNYSDTLLAGKRDLKPPFLGGAEAEIFVGRKLRILPGFPELHYVRCSPVAFG